MPWGMSGFLQMQVLEQITRKPNLGIYSKLLKLRAERYYSSTKLAKILGIETSCDDTSCGIVDSNRQILSDSRHTQLEIHTCLGGIIPPLARDLHSKYITNVCKNALKEADLKLRDLDAIAVTVEPGIQPCLAIGLNFAKYLCKISNKPLIPIHHMQAHALTARLTNQVNYPYLALLVSGGHCLLTFVQNVEKFYILGNVLCNAPGDLMDKIARRLKLHTMKEYSSVSGGQAIEIAASVVQNVDKTMFPPVMTHQRNCMFSFSGLTTYCINQIKASELKHSVKPDEVIPNVHEICAAYQYTIVNHICQRVQRAMEYVDRESLIPEDNRTLVVSGGVAANNYLAAALGMVCEATKYKFVRPPRKLCGDNGVMIAWNGMEKWVSGKDVLFDRKEIEKVQEEPKVPIGEDWTTKIQAAEIKCQWVKLP